MKKALDYVSDYQLKSANCKDAIRIAPSKITQMIFCCFKGLISSHRPYTQFKLVSFFYPYISDNSYIFTPRALRP